VLLVDLVAFTTLAVSAPARVAPVPAMRTDSVGPRPSVEVQTDDSRRHVTVTIGPFHVEQSPDMGEMHDMMMMPRHESLDGVFAWPVTARYHAVKLEVVDARGGALPRRLLHHTYMVNFDRRQLVYPISERPFSFGEETQDIAVPATIGMPMSAGQRMGIVIMWDNLTGHDVDGAYVRYTFGLNRQRQRPAPVDVMPFTVDVHGIIGGADGFDVPPGGRVLTRDFTVAASGHLLAASGHLHDHAVLARIEDLTTGETLVTVRARRDSTGHTLSVTRPIMGLWRSGPHFKAGRPYQLVVVYDNPTSDTLTDAMGLIGGIFHPDHPRKWPAVDPQDPEYQRDMLGFDGVTRLLAELEASRPRVATAQ